MAEGDLTASRFKRDAFCNSLSDYVRPLVKTLNLVSSKCFCISNDVYDGSV